MRRFPCPPQIWQMLLGAAALAVGLLSSRGASAKVDFRPSWIEHYRVRVNGSPGVIPNGSLLDDPAFSWEPGWDLQGFLELDQDKALAWRQQYEDMSRDYEMRERAGILDLRREQAYTSQIQGFTHDVVHEIEKHKIERTTRQAEKRAMSLAERNKTLRHIMAPAAFAAGIYIGQPVRLKVDDSTRLSLRTNFRDRFGQFEVESPLGFGAVEFHPASPAHSQFASSEAVDFGRELNMQHGVDSDERYRFSFSRSVPVLDVTSQVLYGASSSILVGSLSKQLTDNISCAVDSVHWLKPYESTRATEQKFRLRYDIHF